LSRLSADDLRDPLRPTLESRGPLLGQRVPLVHSDNSAEGAGHVVEESFRDWKRDAQTLEAAGARPSQIVDPPRRDGYRRVLCARQGQHLGVELPLGATPARHVRPAVSREDVACLASDRRNALYEVTDN